MNLSLCSIAIAALVIVQLTQGAPITRALPADLSEQHATSSVPLSDTVSTKENAQILVRGIFSAGDAPASLTFKARPSLARITRTWSSLLDANKPNSLRDRVYVPHSPQKSSRVVDPSLELKPAPLKPQLPLDAESADVRARLPENPFDLEPTRPRRSNSQQLAASRQVRNTPRPKITLDKPTFSLDNYLENLLKKQTKVRASMATQDAIVSEIRQGASTRRGGYDASVKSAAARKVRLLEEDTQLGLQIEHIRKELRKLHS